MNEDFGEFITVVSSSEVEPEKMTRVNLNGIEILLTRWQGQVYAFSSRCPHAAADLGEGECYRGKVECPNHGYQFDVRNGRVLWPPDEFYQLKTYPAQESGSLIKIKLPN